MKSILFALIYISCSSAIGQSYTSYFTGSDMDIVTLPKGGICMMGGATEHDEAMKWFLNRASGGDVLVLRASGSDGYNDYMYSDLGISLNSVETIVFNSASASDSVYIQNKIQNAEAIWFAGGDQWNYVSYWRNTLIQTYINEAVNERNVAIGGTSAGMAILGQYYFSAAQGTVTSATVLANPYDNNVTIDSTSFLENYYLQNVLTDTHYDSPNRKGRHVGFLARIMTDYGTVGRGIACNEYTAVCIDENGIGRVFGDYPNYEEAAYFIQPNCAFDDMTPEVCSPNMPMTWQKGNKALNVYKVYGTNTGDNYFDLSDWESGNGGTWEYWFVNNGVFSYSGGEPIDCSTVSVGKTKDNTTFDIYPNPTQSMIYWHTNKKVNQVAIFDVTGKPYKVNKDLRLHTINVELLIPGVYVIKLNIGTKIVSRIFIKSN